MELMTKSSSCYLCGKSEFKKRNGNVRDNSNLEIMECLSCGLVFLSSFDHIKNGFYESSGMHGSTIDIESWTRETAGDDKRRFIYLQEFIKNKSVLDFGCGNGGFLLRARKIAKNVEGVEPDANVRAYFQKAKIKIFSNIDEVLNSFDVITLFHVLEHIPDPRTILSSLAKKLNSGGELIVEVPNANDALLTLYKNVPFSKFTYWSCHLFLFTNSTLSLLATQSGLKINYVKQIQRYPLSNHLYWLSNGAPGGHQKWHFLDSDELHKSYEKQLASVGLCDTLIASFSKA